MSITSFPDAIDTGLSSTSRVPRGWSPAWNGDLAAVVAWLDGGGHVDRLWDYKFECLKLKHTLLMGACGAGQERMVDVLLERGASPDVQDDEGATALMFAAMHGHVGIVRRLLTAGAQLGLSTDSG